MTPVAILCGGKGTRMIGDGKPVPKPLVEIGGRPILWHVMSIYAAHGLNRFVLLCGHGAAEIEAFAGSTPPEWDVTCADTGPVASAAAPPAGACPAPTPAWTRPQAAAWPARATCSRTRPSA